MLVWPEAKGWPQDIGALAILDGGRLLDADGRVLIEAAREHIARRLHLVPRFCQLLCSPNVGLGWPLWVDAPSVDVAEHVGVFPVAPPGGDTEVLRACETLRRRPLQRSRPLWEMWFLPGLPDGRVGLFMKMHHAIADGVAGVATLGAFVDIVPEPPETTAPPWSPVPMPSRSDLLVDNLRRRRHEAERTLAALTRPIGTLWRMRRAWPAMREMFAEGRAPQSSVNRPIGSDRRLAIIRSDLGVAKEIAHAHHAKINDVLWPRWPTATARCSRPGESASRISFCGLSFRCRCTRSSRVKRGATSTLGWWCHFRSVNRMMSDCLNGSPRRAPRGRRRAGRRRETFSEASLSSVCSSSSCPISGS